MTIHGGQRKGAGRKPRPAERHNIRVTKSTWDWLAETGNASEAIEKLVEQEKTKMKKYTVQHLGHPTAQAIREDEWQELSQHDTLTAAVKKIDRSRAHCEPGTWDDHYRVVDQDGQRVDTEQARAEMAWNRKR